MELVGVLTGWLLRKNRREDAKIRQEQNERAAAERAARRAQKHASKAQGLDVFGSVARRADQERRDARELRRPVWYVKGFLRLRSIFDVMLLRANEDHARHAIAEGDDVCDCGLDADELAERRAKKKENRAARQRRRFHRPVSRRNAARAAA